MSGLVASALVALDRMDVTLTAKALAGSATCPTTRNCGRSRCTRTASWPS
ncbi:hypothetical protein GS934_08185 [Rhodococcus hoagii]|nr:hypothetical protein [Prescottella equi]NKZ87500.1 hypothetical protein [Prescottella equi]